MGLLHEFRRQHLFRLTVRARNLAAALLSVATLSTPAVGQQTLVELVRSGQREAVLAAITSPDLDGNAAEPDGSTALLWATYRIDHELVRALLKAGARANLANH